MSLLKKRTQPDYETYNILIAVALQHNETNKCYDIVDEMVQQGFTIGLRTYATLATHYFKNSDLNGYKKLLAKMKEMKFLVPPRELTYAILLYFRNGDSKGALKVAMEVQERYPDDVLPQWNFILKNTLNSEPLASAIDIFEMVKQINANFAFTGELYRKFLDLCRMRTDPQSIMKGIEYIPPNVKLYNKENWENIIHGVNEILGDEQSTKLRELVTANNLIL